MRPRVGALLGWGIAMYATMFLTLSIFLAYGFTEGFLPRTLAFLLLVVISILAGRSLHAHSFRDILPYSISWAAIMITFDIILAVPLSGLQILLDWNSLLMYATVAVAPLFALYPHFDRFSKHGV